MGNRQSRRKSRDNQQRTSQQQQQPEHQLQPTWSPRCKGRHSWSGADGCHYLPCRDQPYCVDTCPSCPNRLDVRHYSSDAMRSPSNARQRRRHADVPRQNVADGGGAQGQPQLGIVVTAPREEQRSNPCAATPTCAATATAHQPQVPPPATVKGPGTTTPPPSASASAPPPQLRSGDVAHNNNNTNNAVVKSETSSYNPFECTICLCVYDDKDRIPTTFPCGHSLCLVHVPQLQQCPLCRAKIPHASLCLPTIALRDAAVLYRGLIGDCDDEDDEDDSQEHPKVSGCLPPAATRTAAATVGGGGGGGYGGGASMAQGRSYNNNNAFQYTPQVSVAAVAVAPSSYLTYDHNQRRAHAATTAAAAGPMTNRVVTTASSRRFQDGNSTAPCSQCGKRCYVSASLVGRCCACRDLRPIQAEGTYLRYVDGVGWSNTGRRSMGYCPTCC